MDLVEVKDTELVPVVETKTNITEARTTAKRLVTALETGYLQLARILYEIEATKIDGPMSDPIYKTWGYSTFADYVETELGIHRKKAESLRYIWYTFQYQLTHLTDDLRARFASLGWTKVRLLVTGTGKSGPSILQMYNSPEWIDRWITLGENSTFSELEAAASKTKEDYANKKLNGNASDQIIEATMDSPGVVEIQDSDFPDTPLTYSNPEQEFMPDAMPPEIPEASLPTVEKFIREGFLFSEEQHEIVKQALKRSSELSNSEKKSHNLSLICMDFLATNDFTDSDEDQRILFLSKLEEHLGLSLVALDSENKRIIYGSDSLNDMTSWLEDSAFESTYEETNDDTAAV